MDPVSTHLNTNVAIGRAGVGGAVPWTTRAIFRLGDGGWYPVGRTCMACLYTCMCPCSPTHTDPQVPVTSRPQRPVRLHTGLRLPLHGPQATCLYPTHAIMDPSPTNPLLNNTKPKLPSHACPPILHVYRTPISEILPYGQATPLCDAGQRRTWTRAACSLL